MPSPAGHFRSGSIPTPAPLHTFCKGAARHTSGKRDRSLTFSSLSCSPGGPHTPSSTPFPKLRLPNRRHQTKCSFSPLIRIQSPWLSVLGGGGVWGGRGRSGPLPPHCGRQCPSQASGMALHSAGFSGPDPGGRRVPATIPSRAQGEEVIH